MSREFENRCPTVKNAVILLSEWNEKRTDKGLEPFDPNMVFCPFTRNCNWVDCVWDYATPKPTPIEKFYTKLETTVEIQEEAAK